jgi:N-acetylglucosaminyldiphosphoundecaprenol N-acetyl-beta-D-mannosaminyltransferase
MSKLNTVKIFNVDVHKLNMEQTVELIDEAIKNRRQVVHNCINANKVVLIQKDDLLRESLDEADIISADGQAVVWASRLFGSPLPERVPGIDLMDEVIKQAALKGYKVFFFGAKEEIVFQVSRIYADVYNKNLIAGYRNGYFTAEEEVAIAKDINDSGASILFVAIPSPQKEIFIKKHKNLMPNVFLMMGVGGSFDVVAGKVRRAPRWMQDKGLEWLYRLIQEPRKMWRRYLIGNLKYILITFKTYLHSGK